MFRGVIHALALVVASSVIAHPALGAETSGFYLAAPSDLAAGKPGSLIRSEPDGNAPLGGRKYRVLYRSTGLDGEPIAVSGMVFVPSGAMPPSGWPIVAWAHPTSGLISRCAPSLARGGTEQVQGLEPLLARGYVVTATDYPGLGTPGPHPFLVGNSEGRAVLDSIRAARGLIGGRSPYAAVWGHSQGGQAALFAGQLAGAYAPDIRLIGVAAAAPATNLADLLEHDLDSSGGKNLLAMTLYSWSEVFGAPIENVVTPEAMPTVDSLANVCLESVADLPARLLSGRTLSKDFLSVSNITALQPWKSLMTANTVGTLPPALPVLLVQGDADDTIPLAVTKTYMESLCKAGSTVRLSVLSGVGHLNAAKKGASDFVAWLDQLASDAAVADDCL